MSRRGRGVVVIDNVTARAEIRLSALDIGADALGLCPPARHEGGRVILVPARTGRVF